MNDTRRNPERSTLDLTCSGPQPQPNHQLPACQPSPGVSNRLCSLLGAPADGRLMAAGSGFLSMRPARRCPHGFPLLMHIGLSKLIGINDENAPLASRLTEAQFRVWGFRWILPCTGFVSTSPINHFQHLRLQQGNKDLAPCHILSTSNSLSIHCLSSCIG